MLEKANRNKLGAVLGFLVLPLLHATLQAAPAGVAQIAAQQYKAAEALAFDGRHESALELIQRIVTEHPHSGTYAEGHFTEPYYPHFLLGWLHMERGDSERALSEFDRELASDAIRQDRQRFRALELMRELAECRLGVAETQP